MSEDRNLVKAVQKALEIMEYMSVNQYCGVRELGKKLGINRSTVNRLMATLEQTGYVTQEEDRGKYRSTLKLFELGNEIIQRLNIREQAYEIMRKLSVDTEETINLALLDGRQVVYISKIDSPHILKSSAAVGSRPPLYCNASGKVILAFLPDNIRKAFFPAEFHPFTPYTIRNLTELEAELTRVRASAYAVDNEEWTLNVKAISAPVWDHDRKVIAALTIAGPTIRMPAQRMEELAQILLKAAQELSAKIGYRDPSQVVYPYRRAQI